MQKAIIIGKKDPHFYAAVLNTHLTRLAKPLEVQARGGAISRMYHALLILEEDYNLPVKIEKTTLTKHVLFDRKTNKKTTIPEVHLIISPARRIPLEY